MQKIKYRLLFLRALFLFILLFFFFFMLMYSIFPYTNDFTPFVLILSLLISTLIIYYKYYKNSLVIKLSKNSKAIFTFPLEQLQEVKDRLKIIERFNNILLKNSITEERYNYAIGFNSLDYLAKANFFAKQISGELRELTAQSYMLTPNEEFPLNVKQFILFMSDKNSVSDMMNEIKEIPQYNKNIFFILSDNSVLQAKVANEKGYEKFVRVQPQTMTKLLLLEDGVKILADSFAEQLALTLISPYNLGGGESNSSMFFGRREIISHMVGRGNNYIVIGSRQIGKSSLLKALEREYIKKEERVHYISVGKGNFVRAMGRALGIKVASLEELVAYISVQKEKVLFLLDEVDPFIKDEKESGYRVLDSFRKLSEEGNCNFILAGYWELYFYTMFDNQSPLKNFGEAIELGALEAEACREMITEPMKQLGLRFESDEAINEIVERTGQRPNLIAIICNNIIKSLGKEKRVVSMADVQEVIKGKKVYELFESWKKLDEDEEASKLDKIIVYSMVEQGSFRLSELLKRLKVLGLTVEMSRLETSLARLKVSYTIERNEEGIYGFMLPLFREYILEDDYSIKLSNEIESYNLYTNSLVVKLLKKPSKLLELPFERLNEIEKELIRIDQFSNILSKNNITIERYKYAMKFKNLNYDQKVDYFSKRVFSTKITKLTKSAYKLTLNEDFPLNVKDFILFLSNKESVADMLSEIKIIPQYRINFFFILSDNSTLQSKIVLEKWHDNFIIVQPEIITKLLLSRDGAKVLADSFAEQLALTQISPYNLGGGESNSSMFFGRREIISHVVGRGNNNYIVIGSRQIGKSSLMKAIEREYVKNQERVHYISVGQGNFVRAMSRALGIKVTTLEELVEYLSVQKEKVLFLLDKIDLFIKDAKKNNYEVLDSFRKLKEEGSCNFILAGYWELYFYTIFDNQSPLKNFGEVIELGALEADACRAMITEPMQQLGLRFESDEAINEIVERTGQRPNLIAIICNNIIKSLGKEKRVVSMADVHEAIKGKKVYEHFESWKKLDEDEEASKLDKIIVYSMVEQGSFRLGELVEKLKALGLTVEMSRLETSLARLKVSYTIERNEEGVYGFMLPLFREYVLRDDYEVKLAGEVEGF